MLDYTLSVSEKKLVPFLTSLREQFGQMGDFRPTVLTPGASAVYVGFALEPPDPECYRHSPHYAPSLQRHSFGVCVQVYQSSERSASIKIWLLYGHDNPGREHHVQPASPLEEKVTALQQQPSNDLALRNGYTPYLKLVGESFYAAWKQFLADSSQGQEK